MPATQPVLAIEEELELDKHPEIKVKVKFDKEVAQRAARFSEALLISRDILDDSNVTAAHPAVLALLDATGGDMKTVDAINAVRIANRQYRQMANDGGMKAAMLDSLFSQERVPGGRVMVKCSIEGLELPFGYWSDKEANDLRLGDWTPPFPKRNPNHPVEQRVAYADALMQENPVFGIRLVGLLEAAVNLLMDNVMEVSRNEKKTDADGFRPNNVGGDVAVSPVAEG